MSYLRQLHNKCEKSKCFYFPVRFLIISLFHKMRKGCNSVQNDVPKCVTTGQLDFVLKVWRSNHQSFPVNKLTVTLWRIATLVICALFHHHFHMFELHIGQTISYSFKNFKTAFKLHFKQKQHSKWYPGVDLLNTLTVPYSRSGFA